MDKKINSTCYCKATLPHLKCSLIMFLPCEHIIHYPCYNNTKKCNICMKKIDSTFQLSDYDNIKKKSDYIQRYIDILSMTNFDYLSTYDVKTVVKNIPNVSYIVGNIPFLKGYDDGFWLSEQVLSLNDVKIKIKGLEKLNDKPKIFIANHTCYFDFFVIYNILKTGFLSSSIIKKTQIGQQLCNVVPLLLIERGVTTNTVDRIKEYVEQEGSICLFPEGMLTHPNTIIRFRTGAFNAGHQVYAIVIKYDYPIADVSVSNFIYKLLSSHKVNIKVKIIGPYNPPFTEENIENIRKDMANAGHMFLSRVSNKDIVDKN